MKTLIAYYTFTNKTEQLAQSLSRYLVEQKHKVTLERILPEKEYSTIEAYTFGCKDAMTNVPRAIKKPKNDASDFDLLVVLQPTWAWACVPPLQAYIAKLSPKKGAKAIAGSTFASGSGTAAVAKKLREKGFDVIAELSIRTVPSFPPEAELRKQFDSIQHNIHAKR